jgi:hypothetical protein
MKIIVTSVTTRTGELPVAEVHGVFEEDASEYEILHGAPEEEGGVQRRGRRLSDKMTSAEQAAGIRFDRILAGLYRREGHTPRRVDNKFDTVKPMCSENEILRYSLLTTRDAAGVEYKVAMQISRVA